MKRRIIKRVQLPIEEIRQANIDIYNEYVRLDKTDHPEAIKIKEWLEKHK